MEEVAKVAMYVTRGCLVVPIQEELHDESMLQVQEDILKIIDKNRIKGVIIDVSGVEVIDSLIAQKIFDSARMTSLLGAKAIVTGLNAGVVASLIDLDFEPGDVTTAISLDDGFRILEPILRAEEEIDEAEETDTPAQQDKGDMVIEDEEDGTDEEKRKTN